MNRSAVDLGESGYKPVAEIVGEQQIVAVGEATHGTSECIESRARLFQELAQTHEFGVFASEMGFAEGERIDAYINGNGHRDGLAIADRETEELVEWMKVFNTSSSATARLRFFGIDMTWGAPSAAALVNELGEIDGTVAERARRALAPMLERDAARVRGNEVEPRLYVDHVHLTDVVQQVQWNGTSTERRKHILRHLEIVRQSDLVYAEAGPRDLRDRFLAENVGWARTATAGAKIMVAAHNGHVSKGPWAELDGEIGHRLPHTSMGWHLRQIYGTGFHGIACVFGSGRFEAIDDRSGTLRIFDASKPIGGSVEALLERSPLEQLFLDLRALPESGPVAEWFMVPRPYRLVGLHYSGGRGRDWRTWVRVVVAMAFDGMIYVDESTPPRKPTPYPG